MDIFITYGLKPLFIFIGSFIFIRLGGKKAASEMSSFDLLFIIVIGTIVSEPLVTKSVLPAFAYAGALLVIYALFSYSTLNNKLRWLLIASPTVLIKNGDIDEKGLRKSKVTTSELLSTLREKGYTDPKNVELATMEDTGRISVIPKSSVRPVQPTDIQLQPSPTFIPIPLIMNGQIINHNLKYLEKNEDWLSMQLKTHQLNLKNISDITLATYNQYGTLSIDTDDPIDNSQKGNPYLYKPGKNN
ncbi:UPF0702 transmembrane protein YkjA [Lentibacillus kapialis]|uniref:UPF0702 transmembrane protein YkjA n=1 Tax=Lentibacillus kapialis TaxID=340214 RepID=A0A917UYS9_9BACI|nr:DUF421 domain-containing protein [Lentibacillus kapialis]GGJ97730.1 UPF0702 transmembrane protein YkjA [Lentibacillus kapialis]